MAKTTRRKATKRPARTRAQPRTARQRRPATTGRAAGRNAQQPSTKAARILALLQRPEGATLAELVEVTGWQAHSVRGYLSGTVRKRTDVTLLAEVTATGRRYRTEPAIAAKTGA